jgi:GH24 family phage-related lysozyme (muramidase)
MLTDWDGIKFIGRREACVLVAYEDGWDITIVDGKEIKTKRYSDGFGTRANGPDEVIDENEAFRRLIQHVRTEADMRINKLLKVELSQHMYNALASLVYQTGLTRVRPTIALFNTVHPNLALISFAAYGFSNPGLIARRIREMIMGLDGYYGDVSQYKLYRGPPHETQPEWTAFPSAVPNI